MRLDDPPFPFGIEQIGEAARRVIGLHQICVVTEPAEGRAHGRVHAVRIGALRRIMPRNILGHERREPVVAFPRDEMRSVGTERDIDRRNAACLFLTDALEDALRTGPFYAHGDARIYRLKRAAELLGEWQVERTIKGELALPARGLDQGRSDRGRWRRSSFHRLAEQRSGSQRSRCLQDVPSRISSHGGERISVMCTSEGQLTPTAGHPPSGLMPDTLYDKLWSDHLIEEA